jgi:hypothetical protein
VGLRDRGVVGFDEEPDHVDTFKLCFSVYQCAASLSKNRRLQNNSRILHALTDWAHWC